MRRNFIKVTALVTVAFLMAVACIPVFSVSGAQTSYEKTGLQALYVGNDNTGSGQDKTATTWKDLSGKGNDITSVPKTDTNYFTDTGYHLDTIKVNFPTAIKDIVNGTEFTVEMALGDFTPKGSSWNTLLNSTNDSFSLFRTKGDNTLNFKSQTTLTSGNKGNARPSTGNAESILKNSTVAITFKLNGKITMYVNGVQVGSQTDAKYQLNCDDFYFGHSDPLKNHASEYRAMRFYSTELTAAQIAANYKEDQRVLYGIGDTSSSSSSTSSEPSSSSSSATSSVTPPPTDGSMGNPVQNPGYVLGVTAPKNYKPGDEIKVTITLKSVVPADGISLIHFYLYYDNTLVEPKVKNDNDVNAAMDAFLVKAPNKTDWECFCKLDEKLKRYDLSFLTAVKASQAKADGSLVIEVPFITKSTADKTLTFTIPHGLTEARDSNVGVVKGNADVVSLAVDNTNISSSSSVSSTSSTSSTSSVSSTSSAGGKQPPLGDSGLFTVVIVAVLLLGTTISLSVKKRSR